MGLRIPKKRINTKSVLDPEGNEKTLSTTDRTVTTSSGSDTLIDSLLGNKTNTTYIEDEQTIFTDASGRKLSDLYSGDQTAIKKNLEKRKSLLSQGIGAGKSLLGGAVI